MKWWLSGLVICVVIGGFFSLFASQSPDGLERVAEDKEFIEAAKESSFEIMPDYAIPEIRSDALSASFAGIIGVIIMMMLGYGVGILLRRKE
jgi:hypothetical protein